MSGLGQYMKKHIAYWMQMGMNIAGYVRPRVDRITLVAQVFAVGFIPTRVHSSKGSTHRACSPSVRSEFHPHTTCSPGGLPGVTFPRAPCTPCPWTGWGSHPGTLPNKHPIRTPGTQSTRGLVRTLHALIRKPVKWVLARQLKYLEGH